MGLWYFRSGKAEVRWAPFCNSPCNNKTTTTWHAAHKIRTSSAASENLDRYEPSIQPFRDVCLVVWQCESECGVGCGGFTAPRTGMCLKGGVLHPRPSIWHLFPPQRFLSAPNGPLAVLSGPDVAPSSLAQPSAMALAALLQTHPLASCPLNHIHAHKDPTHPASRVAQGISPSGAWTRVGFEPMSLSRQ